ncbi:hypothetical protein ABTJ37_23020, partial [Acinetobacter baumannii]
SAMHPLLKSADTVGATPISFVTPASLKAATDTLTPAQNGYLAAIGFEPKPGKVAVLPAADGAIAAVLFGVEAEDAAHRDPL